MLLFVLFGLLILLVGIGKFLVIIVLVVYVLLFILWNIYIGIRELDEFLIEVVKVMGMNSWRRLWKVEFFFVLFIIMVGICIVMVLIVGMVILVVFIGVGGFGKFILLGIDWNDYVFIILGVVLVVLFVLFFDIVFCIFEWLKCFFKCVILMICIVCIMIVFLFFWSIEKKDIVIVGKFGLEFEILI